MSDNDKRPTPEMGGEAGSDPSADFVRDLATTSPPKSFETVKAASDALEHVEETVRRRAYELWEAHGRPEGRQADFWLMAEDEAREGHGGGA